MKNDVGVMRSVVDDLRPERLKGYGEINAEACCELDEIVQVLQQQLIAMLQK